MRIYLIIYTCLALLPIGTNAQYLFERNDSIPVSNGSAYLANPWAGGINLGQFSKVDLDQDGLEDLFVFDRSGNVVITFRNEGTPGTVNYVHDFQYQPMFAGLHDWALMADYNCDGKNDLFSYSTGGFNMYKNVSTPGNLQFDLLDETVPYTRTSALGNYINLYVSAVDLPAFIDVDNDSDLDVLTFDIWGSRLEYHENLAIDSFGVCDSTRYLLSNMCWGHFREASLNNSVSLFDTCSFNVSNPRSEEVEAWLESREATQSMGERSVLRHSGSTVMSLDMNGDGVKEVVLGDVAFSNMVMLTNGGTTVNSNSSMIAQDTAFPQNSGSTIPVDMDIFPAGFHLDINNDGVRDFIAAPNAQNVSKNHASAWYYENLGNDSIPDFEYVQNDFLQKDMIEVGEGAYPVLFDYNADGLKDLLVANYGYYSPGAGFSSALELYENVGTSTVPEFEYITSDYLGLASHGLGEAIYPTFGDMDNDGDEDMFCGNWEGKLHYYENTAGPGNPAVFVLTIPNYTDNLGATIDVGEFSTPQIIDLDRDNDPDLVVGERRGNINYYENIGTSAAPVLQLVDDTLGGVLANFHLENYGYSVPHFFEDSSSYRLFVGTSKGYVKYYENIDGNLTGAFTEIDTMYMDIWEGKRSGVWVEDINGDNLMDLFYGNYRGGIAFYKGVSHLSVGIQESETAPELILYPNPANNELNIRISNFSGSLTVSLLNLLGQELMQRELMMGKTSFNISDFPNGVYLISASNGVSTTVQKFIINK